MTTPIILKITEAGKNAILDSNNTGLTLRLSQLAIGSGQYTPTGNETALQGEISRHGIVSGNVESQSHTLRFSSSITSNNETAVYEIGLITENNVLFAVASSTNKPLLKVYPDITFVGSFGLTLDDLDTSKITVVNDPNGALSIVLMQQHLATSDPHPQYAMKKNVNQEIDDLNQTLNDMLKNKLKALQDEMNALAARPFEGIPVGGILATTKSYNNGDEVAADLRYGKWARYAQGKVLAGYSLLATDIAEYKTMGNEFGENTHTLTVDEMPSHNHNMNLAKFYHGRDGGTALNAQWSDGDTTSTGTRLPDNHATIIDPMGGDKSHNNIQPSIVVAFWVRMPNDYTTPIYKMFWTTDSEGNNRITLTGENQELYLWLTAQNMAQSMAIGASIETGGITFNPNANFVYPNTIGNGKHRLAYLPADSYVATANTTLNMGVIMADGTALNAPIVINDTVENTPVVVGDSVFVLGATHATEGAKIIRIAGDIQATLKDFSLGNTYGESKQLIAATIELDKLISLNDLYVNTGWQVHGNYLIWLNGYSGNPNIQGRVANNPSQVPIPNISLDSTGKIITLTVQVPGTYGFADFDLPFQIIIGNDISVVVNTNQPSTDRYDNVNNPITNPFVYYNDWIAFVDSQT